MDLKALLTQQSPAKKKGTTFFPPKGELWPLPEEEVITRYANPQNLPSQQKPVRRFLVPCAFLINKALLN